MSRNLYRYICFEDFINLTINNKDRFVRPSSWDDKYEGGLLTRMEESGDVRQIVRKMYNILCIRNYYAIPNNYFGMWHSKWFSYAQCWSRHPETDAMWRCYSYGNKALRIRTREDRLLNHTKKIFPETECFSVFLQKVNYDLNKKSLMEQQIKQMKDTLFMHETYFHKRPAFKHEGEYRLLIVDNSLYNAEDLSSLGVKFKIEEQVNGKNDEEIINYLTEKICGQRVNWSEHFSDNVRIEDAGDISEFIEGIMVHPLAPEWYVKIIQDIIQGINQSGKMKFKIKFDGQSEIYKLK